MIIDVHVHPGFYADICEDKDRVNRRKKAMGWDLMSPFPLELVYAQMDYAKIDKLVLLASDLTTITGEEVISNDEVASIVRKDPLRFIGFASVDPHREDALEVLDYAFGELGLMGLKLHPSKQKFYPNDPKLFPIYEKCLQYNKPITFHAGMSWQPDAPMKYAQPINFEEVAIRYPQLRMNLAHFGFPWVVDTAALILKYPNVYADTAGVYMDSPEQFFDQIFTKLMGPFWVDHNLADKILFGSNSPRFRPARIRRGLDSLELSTSTREKILGKNALKFLGMEG